LTDPIIDSYPAKEDFIILLFKTSSLTFCWVVVVTIIGNLPTRNKINVRS